MKWRIDFSKDSLRFITQNKIKDNFITDEIGFALRKFSGENINVDIKKLKGEWADFYRIRSGKIRIIVEFQFENCLAYIEKIDWRGNVYK